jgi:hypothetical protein
LIAKSTKEHGKDHWNTKKLEKRINIIKKDINTIQDDEDDTEEGAP